MKQLPWLLWLIILSRSGNCACKHEAWIVSGVLSIWSHDQAFPRNANGFKKFYINLEDEVSFVMSKEGCKLVGGKPRSIVASFPIKQ